MKKFGMALLMLLLSICTSAIEAADLVFYMPFDEGQGNFTKDVAGDTEYDVTGTQWGEGKFGTKALVFGPGTSYVLVGNEVEVLNMGSSDFTIALWVKKEGSCPNGYAQWVGWHNGGTTGAFAFGNHNNILFWNFASPGGHDFGDSQPNVAVEEGVWNHFAAVRVGENLTFYKNAEVVAERQIADPLDTNQYLFRIGNENNLAAQFPGTLDEVVVYRDALSETELKKLLEGPASTAVNPLDKLISTWGNAKIYSK